MRFIQKKILLVQAAVFAGAMTAPRVALAGGNTFGNIAENITNSIEALPGLVSGVAYMFGLLLGVLGILKVKDHVENPGQTPLKDGAIRMAAGGALFGLPIVYEAMRNTIGITSNSVGAAVLNGVDFNVQ